MTNFAGVIDNSFGQTVFAGESADRLYEPSLSPESQAGMPQPVEEPSYPDVDALVTPVPASTQASGFPGSPGGIASYLGLYDKKHNAAQEWFELVHVKPSFIALGNVVSTVQVSIAIFNADRYLGHFLNDFTNNAGDGISITDLPSLPYTIPLLSGLDLTLEVTLDGPPTIDGDLVFDFDLYNVSIPITGTRVIVFPFQPQAPMREFLRFNTQVIDKVNGSEQRIKMRKNPRQEFIFNLRADGPERAAIQNFLFDRQAGSFGIPIWTEPSYLTASVAMGATSLAVDSTRYADFRVGGLLLIFRDRFTYDALPIASTSQTVINLDSPTNIAFPVGTLVMPMRLALTVNTLGASRRIMRLADTEIRFRVVDNDVNLASAAAFNTFKGKVLFDDFNVVRGALPEQFERRLYTQDPGTGLFSQQSLWDRNKRSHTKGFRTRSRKELWELRQLLHHIAGRVESFYIPTFYDDLLPTATLSSGSPSLTIENVGYTKFVQDRKVSIRIHLTDGTFLDRDIGSSSEIDAETEQLTLDDVWPANIPVANVARIEFIELVRFTDDDFEITHRNARGDADMTAPIVEVFE